MREKSVRALLKDEFEVNTSDEMNVFMKTFFILTSYLNMLIVFVAGTALVLMMSLIVFNAIKRIFSDPFAGTVEVVGWLAAIVATFSLGFAQMKKSHVFIDSVLNLFHAKVRDIIHTIMNVISVCFFSLVFIYLIKYGFILMGQGVLSDTLQIVFYPITILCSVGFIGLVLALVREIILIWR